MKGPSPSSRARSVLQVMRVQLSVPETAAFAFAADLAHLQTCRVSRNVSRALTLAPACSHALSSPTATALTAQIATRTAALSAATHPKEPPCASERLRAATQRAAAPTAALQPTCSTAAPKERLHSPSAPPATAHARRVLPAASAPLQARAVRICAMQAPTPPLSVQYHAPPALLAHILHLLARLQSSRAPPAPQAPTALQAHRSSAAAPSTRMPPLLVASAPAAPALGKLYPQRDRASA